AQGGTATALTHLEAIPSADRNLSAGRNMKNLARSAWEISPAITQRDAAGARDHIDWFRKLSEI
ncbi:hypothetical protein, partial [Croceicoccus bisphenolivorans]|uniref:hypothetical protein n=1 Tax=Croceicoccus bisphenolivorans TaxID=1783232 RepID=UPI001C12CA98